MMMSSGDVVWLTARRITDTRERPPVLSTAFQPQTSGAPIEQTPKIAASFGALHDVIRSDTRSIEQRTNDTTVVVGVTCSVLGLLLGISATALVCAYRRRDARHSVALEKNPKEMTFEPLDLTLTLSEYERNVTSGTRHPRYCESYQGFQLPSPPTHDPRQQHRSFFYIESDLNRDQEADSSPDGGAVLEERYIDEANYKMWTGFASLDSRVLKANSRSKQYKANYRVHQARAATISTRGSYSSGLGTFTESEIYSCETRTPPLLCRGSESRVFDRERRGSKPSRVERSKTLSRARQKQTAYSKNRDWYASSRASSTEWRRDASSLPSSSVPPPHNYRLAISRNSLPSQLSAPCRASNEHLERDIERARNLNWKNDGDWSDAGSRNRSMTSFPNDDVIDLDEANVSGCGSDSTIDL